MHTRRDEEGKFGINLWSSNYEIAARNQFSLEIHNLRLKKNLLAKITKVEKSINGLLKISMSYKQSLLQYREMTALKNDHQLPSLLESFNTLKSLHKIYLLFIVIDTFLK